MAAGPVAVRLMAPTHVILLRCCLPMNHGTRSAPPFAIPDRSGAGYNAVDVRHAGRQRSLFESARREHVRWLAVYFCAADGLQPALLLLRHGLCFHRGEAMAVE